MTQTIISGALAMGYFIAAMFFLKYWTAARDRLFALFATAFGLLALQRLALPYAPADLAWRSSIRRSSTSTLPEGGGGVTS